VSLDAKELHTNFIVVSGVTTKVTGFFLVEEGENSITTQDRIQVFLLEGLRRVKAD
jgi:hypothetical protein